MRNIGVTCACGEPALAKGKCSACYVNDRYHSNSGFRRRRKISNRKYLQTHREKAKVTQRWRMLRYKYGVTKEWYEAKLADQKGLCAICKQPERVLPRLSIDHDHTTEEPRALVCFFCNTALGSVRESIPTLEAMIAYLKSFAVEGSETLAERRNRHSEEQE